MSEDVRLPHMKIMLNEKDYVLSAFRAHFGACAGKRFAIYGIGQNTRHILEHFPEFTFIGIMDEARTGDTVFGKRVISLAEARALGVEAIIIVARASNTRIIYRRIAAFCKEQSIPAYDINGNVMGAEQDAANPFEKYADISEAALRKKIENADIVSFDVFDTLVMRRCLYPRDVFYLIGNDFAKARINAETALYAEGGHPNIYDIYDTMDGSYSPQKELDAEAGVLIARDRMVAMLEYAGRLGKDVWLTSDMYLPNGILALLLERMGIRVAVDHILVSCDAKAAKHNGLFDVLRSRAGAGRILHIGDNHEADIVGAERYGIEDTFYIKGAVGMLEDSYADELLRHDSTLPNRLVIGEFVARQLNNPFLFSETRGKFAVNSHREMASSFIAPMVWCFFGWLIKRALALRVDEVLLSSRDGCLIERIYDELKDEFALPPMRYFYTSRAVAVIAGLDNAQDILHAARLAYAGTPEEMLRRRFHLDAGEVLERGADESDEEYILRHSDDIRKKAAEVRTRYMRYIDGLGIRPQARVGFFDFISAGTCQKSLSGIVDFELFGLYFASTNLATDYKPHVHIEGMFGVLNAFKAGWHLLESHFFMENVLTSFEPTLSGFDETGAPLFSRERRSRAQLIRLGEIHDAVLEYIRGTKIRLDDAAEVDRAVPDLILHFLESKYCAVDMDYFREEELLDEFCNRKFTFQG